MILEPTVAAPQPDPREKAAIVAEWKRLAAEPPPANPRPLGCATFLVSATLLIGLPALGRTTGFALPGPMGTAVFAVLCVLLAGGFIVGVFFGSGVYGRAAARANAALDWLAANPGPPDPEAGRRNAVCLLFNAVVSEGPTTAGTVDVDAAKAKLGANLAFVQAVERVLVAESLVLPLLTAGANPGRPTPGSDPNGRKSVDVTGQ